MLKTAGWLHHLGHTDSFLFDSFTGDIFWLLGAKSHDGHRFLPFTLKIEESIDLFCDIGPLTATVEEDGHTSLSIRVGGVIRSGLGC